MRDLVAPMYDQAYSALLEDLAQRGMLDNTLVCNLAEFGRTPKVNPAGGRDHWPGVWTVGFAGGGVKGGRVVGKSDEIGGYPAERPVAPANVVATIYHSLGHRPRNRAARPARPALPAHRPRLRSDQGAVLRLPGQCRNQERGFRLLFLLSASSPAAAWSSCRRSLRRMRLPFAMKSSPSWRATAAPRARATGRRRGRGASSFRCAVMMTRAIISRSPSPPKGRRVNLDDPARSLLLLKATKLIPHKGGERFKMDSPEYKILADWIASGAPGPQEQDARIDHIEISPPHTTALAGQTLPMKVTAIFNDGHREDVTRWTKYTAGNNSVATVNDDGAVKVVGNGEGTVTAWYLSKLAIATVTVPYTQPPQPAAFAQFKPRNFIDERVLEKLHELNLPPSERCTDAEFIRRAFLDTIGVLPTPEETRAFLAETTPDKRDHLVDALLVRPEFVDYWAYKWSDLLLVNSDKLPEVPMWTLLPVDPPAGGDQYAVGRVRAQPAHRHRQHAAKTARAISSSCTMSRRSWRRRCPSPSSACRSIARSATIIRWRNGRTTSTSRSPISSRACGRRTAPSPMSA